MIWHCRAHYCCRSNSCHYYFRNGPYGRCLNYGPFLLFWVELAVGEQSEGELKSTVHVKHTSTTQARMVIDLNNNLHKATVKATVLKKVIYWRNQFGGLASCSVV